MTTGTACGACAAGPGQQVGKPPISGISHQMGRDRSNCNTRAVAFWKRLLHFVRVRERLLARGTAHAGTSLCHMVTLRPPVGNHLPAKATFAWRRKNLFATLGVVKYSSAFRLRNKNKIPQGSLGPAQIPLRNAESSSQKKRAVCCNHSSPRNATP